MTATSPKSVVNSIGILGFNSQIVITSYSIHYTKLYDNGNSGLVYAWNTNFAIYKDIDFGSFTDTIKFYHADIRGAAVEFWLDRKIINERQLTIRVPDASNDYNNVSGKELDGGVFLGRYDFLHDETFRGNDKWAEFKLPIVPVSGIHDLYVVFLRGGRESVITSYSIHYTKLYDSLFKIVRRLDQK